MYIYNRTITSFHFFDFTHLHVDRYHIVPSYNIPTRATNVLSTENCHEGAVESIDVLVAHDTITHGNNSPSLCPNGYVGELTVECDDGTASVQDGECIGR